ncbi:MAG: 6-carboxytetrahydropterin synthase [Terriglobia bacterium]|jgi:6-pyruvoyltetrahydropterin/6-carboxytetrahydropterin synthase
MVYLTRRYRFSASHRLHNDNLTPEDNTRLYGKCDNAFGHGHNYVLEVTVAGEVDPQTGMVIDVGIMDSTVQRQVLDRFDLIYLNLDDPHFRTVVPTTENVCTEIFAALKDGLSDASGGPAARLDRVRLEETPSNFFEYFGDGSSRI